MRTHARTHALLQCERTSGEIAGLPTVAGVAMMEDADGNPVVSECDGLMTIVGCGCVAPAAAAAAGVPAAAPAGLRTDAGEG